MGKLIPKIISPQAHRRFDSFALPGLIGATAWMSRRNRPAASLVALATAIEGTAFLTTNFPPGVLPWMTFRDHVQLTRRNVPKEEREGGDEGRRG